MRNTHNGIQYRYDPFLPVCRHESDLRAGRKRKFKAIEKSALSRLLRLNAATSLQDLAAIRGNRLEALMDDRKGKHSIRINDQYRICFVWSESEKAAQDVEIVDYH
jgi:toxin HigB-1